MENFFVIFANPLNEKYIVFEVTNDISRSLNELNSNDFKPFDFEVYAKYKSGDKVTPKELKTLVNKWFPQANSVDMKVGKAVIQFYEIPRENALNMLQTIAKISGTENNIELGAHFGGRPFQKKEEDYVYTEKESRFRFSECGIEIGETIEYKFDTKIKATVYDDRHVLYNGEISNLTTLARKVTGRDSKNGPRDFLYRGRTLAKLRKEKNAK